MSSAAHRKLRPWYLVVAMLLTWLIGVQGVMNGCSVMVLLRQGGIMELSQEVGKQDAGDPMQVIPAVIQAARLRAMADISHITFPLSAAKLLLSCVLVIVVGLAMNGRPGVRTFAIQAILANALLAVVDYALTRSVRISWIDAAVRATSTLPPTVPLPQREMMMISHETLWWFERIRFFVFELGAFGLAALTLRTDRTKAYFAAVEKAVKSSEDL